MGLANSNWRRLNSRYWGVDGVTTSDVGRTRELEAVLLSSGLLAQVPSSLLIAVVAPAPVVDDAASDSLVNSWFALLTKYEVIVRFADLFIVVNIQRHSTITVSLY